MVDNVHGLSRHIPEAVKRAVRARCGFGCALCGATITEYEHFMPDYADAERHDPERIVLLCPNHHAKVTKGLVPKQKVLAASVNPEATKVGFSKEEHPFFEGIPSLRFGGGALIRNTPTPLMVRGEKIISFAEPENGSVMTRISASLRDASGSHFLCIDNNEWKVMAGTWDFECKGSRYIFRNSAGQVMLQLRMDPPNFIAVEILRTVASGMPVDVNEDRMIIGGSRLVDCTMSNCRVGIAIG